MVGKHLMTKNEKVFLAISGVVLAIIFTIGATNAFAEEQRYYEPKFKFPLPAESNIDGIVEKCGLRAISDIEMHIQCDFIIKFSEDGMSWWVELIEQVGLISADVKDRKDLGLEEQPPAVIKDDYDIALEKLEEIITDPDVELTPAEEEFYELLTQYTECTRGYEQARGIQTEGSWRVGAIFMGDDPEWAPINIERGQLHSILARAVQECLAQNIHLLPMLGDYRVEGDVRTPQSWFGTIQTYHGDLAKDIPTWSAKRVLEESNQGFRQMTPHDILCESDKVSRNYKQDQGCTFEQIYPPCKTVCDGTGLGLFKTDNIPERDNSAWDKFQQYKVYGDAEMLAEIQAEVIADKQRQLREFSQTR